MLYTVQYGNAVLWNLGCIIIEKNKHLRNDRDIYDDNSRVIEKFR